MKQEIQIKYSFPHDRCRYVGETVREARERIAKRKKELAEKRGK